MPYPTEPLEILGAWTGALLTIFIYSYILWRENYAFRWAEHTYIASTFAVAIVQAVRLIRNNIVAPLMGGDIRYIVPIILGLSSKSVADIIQSILVPELIQGDEKSNR